MSELTRIAAPDGVLPAASLVRPEFLMEIEAPPLPNGVGAPPAVVGG